MEIISTALETPLKKEENLSKYPLRSPGQLINSTPKAQFFLLFALVLQLLEFHITNLKLFHLDFVSLSSILEQTYFLIG